MGRPIKTAKLINGILSDTGYDNGDGLGVVGGEVDTTPSDTVKTIQCKFNDGSGVLTGWIVRQKGSRKFLVTDGSVTATCILANTATPAFGEMSIQITTADPATKFLAKFNDTLGATFDGTLYHLTFGAASLVPPLGSLYGIATVAST